MAPNHYLQLAGIILSCILKVAAGYLVCVCLARILRRPDLRFRVWLAFVLASGIYWTGLLTSAIRHWSFNDSGRLSAVGSSPSPTHWLVPLRWSQDITISGRILLGVYLSVVLMLACRKAWVHIRLRSLLSLGSEPSPEVSSLFEDLRCELGVARCELEVLQGLRSPATAYWWRPRVVLPEETADLGVSPQLASIFCHELTHVQRRDYFWSNVTDIMCGFLFFHPAVWQARKHMRLERELACDLAVVMARPDFRVDYADNLARFVRRSIIQEGISCGVDFAASASILGVRIRNILAEPARLPWWKKLSSATAAAGLLLVFMVVSPELSVGIDFAGDALKPAHLLTRVAPRPAAMHNRQQLGAASARKQPHTGQTVEAGQQDSLRGVKTRSYLPETPAYRLSSGNYTPTSGSAPNWDAPALSEPSPANPTVSQPSVTDSVTKIVLGTVGGVIIHERSEHGGHGRVR